MSTIDEGIVSMRFDNKDFERNVAATIDSLENLRRSLNFGNTDFGLDDVQKEVNAFSLQNIEDALDNVSAKFGVLGAIGFSAINNLTNTVIDAGKRMGSALIDPIVSGGAKRSLAIENAKFQFRGLGLDVEKTMESARLAVTGTAFGLDAAATAAAQFGGSGIQAGKDMTSALRAIAGVAAQTNTSFAEMSDVFTSAAGKGKVSGYELQRIAQRGLNVAAVLGKQWGKTETEIRELASEGKISFKQFYQAMDEAFGKNAQKANETYTGALANLRAALSRVGANIAGPRFEALKDIFNALAPVIDKISAAFSDMYRYLARVQRIGADAIVGWLKGLNLEPLKKIVWLLTKGLYAGLQAVKSVLKPIQEAFRDVFPAPTIKQITILARRFKEFFENLKIGEGTTNLIYQAFKTFFILIRLGLSVIKNVLGVIGKFFAALTGGGQGLGDLSEKLAKFFETINYWLLKASGSAGFFEKLGAGAEGLANILRPILDAIVLIGKAFGELLRGNVAGFFSNLKLSGYAVSDVFDGFGKALGNVVDGILDFLGPVGDLIKATFDKIKEAFGYRPKLNLSGLKSGKKVFEDLGTAGDRVAAAWDKIVGAFSSSGKTLAPALKKIGELIGAVGSKLVDWIKNADIQDVLAVINTIFLITLYRTIKKYVSVLEELAESFTGIMDQISGGLELMQKNVKANIILKIAIAIGILAVSLWLLSKVPIQELVPALGALGGMFFLLNWAMKSLVETMDNAKNLNSGKLVAVGAALIMLSIAIAQLSVAAKILGSMSMADLTQGLAGVGALIAATVGFLSGIKSGKHAKTASGAQMLATAAALVILATAIQMLAVVVAVLGRMDPAKLGQGYGFLVALIAAVGGLALGLAKSGPFAIKGALGAVILVGAISLLVGLIKTIAAIPKEDIGKGLVILGTLMAGLGLFFGLLANNPMIAGGAAAVGAGILAAALGIKVLADAFIDVSKIPWKDGLKAIGALAALSLVLAAFGAVGTVFGFGLIAIGVAFAMIGAGMLAMGIGATMLTGALAALALVGAPAITLLLTLLEGILQLIPLFAQQLALGVVAFATALGDAGPELIAAVTKLIAVFLASLKVNLPKIEEIFGLLVTSGLKVFDENSPKFIKSGINFIVNLLKGIRDRAREMAGVAGETIAEFIRGIGDGARDIVDAATETLLMFMWGMQENMNLIIDTAASVVITFLEGLAKTIDERSEDFYNAGWDIIFEIIQGMLGGLLEGPRRIAEGAANLAWSAINRVRQILGIASPSRVFMEIGRNVNEGFAIGIRQSVPEIKQAFKDLNEELKSAIQEANATIDQETKNRAQLMSAEDPDYEAIRESTKAIDEAINVRDRSRKARLVLQRNLKDERQELINLRKSYESVTEKLIEAKDKLKNLKEEKIRKQDELFNQYNRLPDITKTMGLQGYIRDTKKITEANNKYRQSLDQLRKLGLDDASYKKLLAEGPDAQSLVNQLASGGKAAVAEFNKVNKNLEASAKRLADKAASELYDAGIQAARGLVNGLKKNQRDLRIEMNKLATYMVNSIKKALGIKSPSREFMEVAKYAVLGLLKGFKDSKDAVRNAAANLGEETLSKLRKIFEKIRDEAAAGIDTEPVVSPVVNLDDFNKALKEMNEAKLPDLELQTSLKSALNAARIRRAYSEFEASGAKETVRQVVFQQTNNSPEALSEAEIYRQSKNLLSQIK